MYIREMNHFNPWVCFVIWPNWLQAIKVQINVDLVGGQTLYQYTASSFFVKSEFVVSRMDFSSTKTWIKLRITQVMICNGYLNSLLLILTVLVMNEDKNAITLYFASNIQADLREQYYPGSYDT